MKPVHTMKGVGESLAVYPDRLTITPKRLGDPATRGTRGVKTIPLASITAIRFNEAGEASGFLQFTLPEGDDRRHGEWEGTPDENTFVFGRRNKQAQQIKAYIEARMREPWSAGM